MVFSGRVWGVLDGFGWGSLRLRAIERPVVAVLFAIVFAGAGRVLGTGAAAHPSVLRVDEPSIVVLKSRRVLHLFDGDRLVRTYPIDLGVAPRGTKRLRGDGRTPEGRFRIISKNERSRYHRFLGIDYPDRASAEWGLRNGVISAGQAASIEWALDEGRCPDWGTALGGGIGIHGGRPEARSDERQRDDRRRGDWTGGCIAVGDAEIEELFGVLRIGDPIEILP